MRHARLSEKCTFMYNSISKHDHLWETEDFKKNGHPCKTMHQNMIIYQS